MAKPSKSIGVYDVADGGLARKKWLSWWRTGRSHRPERRSRSPTCSPGSHRSPLTRRRSAVRDPQRPRGHASRRGHTLLSADGFL